MELSFIDTAAYHEVVREEGQPAQVQYNDVFRFFLVSDLGAEDCQVFRS